jgi:glycosyltransferase involved in cell wall biosynthesis
MSDPLVSIVIPAYNAARYIRETIEAIRAQTCSDYEIIVVNDGSPDTVEFENAIFPYREFINYLFQSNRGAAAARNTALRIARGRYVAFLDADDFWLATYLEHQLAFLAAHPDVDLVYADAHLIGDSPLAGHTFMQTAPSRGAVTVKSLLSLTCHVIASGVVARRSVILDAGMFDETIRRGHDFDLWVRLASRGARLAYQRRVLLTRQIHLDSLSGDAISESERALAGLRRIERTLALSADEREALEKSVVWLTARIEIERGKLCFGAGDVGGAIAAVERAYHLAPRVKLGAILFALRIAPRWLRWLTQVRRASALARRQFARSPLVSVRS